MCGVGNLCSIVFSFLVKKFVVICKNLSRSVLYFNLLTSGKLYEHLAEIDTSARDMAEYLIKEMAKKQGVTEELKATDMMRWIGLMNNIRVCADEIVLNDSGFLRFLKHLRQLRTALLHGNGKNQVFIYPRKTYIPANKPPI